MPPAPKPQHRRTNSPPTDRVIADGHLRGPDLVGRHSAMGQRWYAALRQSGQAQHFEPSDWAQAELIVQAIDDYLKDHKAFHLQAIEKMSSQLLVTEGARRRLRLEVERPSSTTEPATQIDDARRKLRSV